MTESRLTQRTLTEQISLYHDAVVSPNLRQGKPRHPYLIAFYQSSRVVGTTKTKIHFH